jgi:hypothetical protein
MKVAYPDYEIEEYFSAVAGVTSDEGKRCPECWRLRADKSAEFAKRKGFDAFTTTLLISPYQSKDKIKEICREAGSKHGVEFVDEDFSKGFGESHRKAKEMGLYMQRYCGCVFSEFSRYKNKI